MFDNGEQHRNVGVTQQRYRLMIMKADASVFRFDACASLPPDVIDTAY